MDRHRACTGAMVVRKKLPALSVSQALRAAVAQRGPAVYKTSRNQAVDWRGGVGRTYEFNSGIGTMPTTTRKAIRKSTHDPEERKRVRAAGSEDEYATGRTNAWLAVVQD